jgi:hypothetical protein
MIQSHQWSPKSRSVSFSKIISFASIFRERYHQQRNSRVAEQHHRDKDDLRYALVGVREDPAIDKYRNLPYSNQSF